MNDRQKVNDFLDLDEIVSRVKPVSGGSGGEYAGPCPWCGGKDRFRVWPEHPASEGGRFYCRGCGRQGDLIAYVMERDGVGYREACAKLDRSPKETFKRHKQAMRLFEPKKPTLPTPTWQGTATRFALWAHSAYMDRVKLRGKKIEVVDRGLFIGEVERKKIGWNISETYGKRENWGLDAVVVPETGREKRVWLPAGMVLPNVRQGKIVGLKVRREGWKHTDKLPKYINIVGSTLVPTVLSWKTDRPAIIVESEIDAFLIDQCAGDMVNVVALGTARGKPDAELHDFLKKVPFILVSLDNDDAGRKAMPWWRTIYDNVGYWVYGVGKDPGDILKDRNLSIREWIKQGLTYYGEEHGKVTLSWVRKNEWNQTALWPQAWAALDLKACCVDIFYDPETNSVYPFYEPFDSADKITYCNTLLKCCTDFLIMQKNSMTVLSKQEQKARFVDFVIRAPWLKVQYASDGSCWCYIARRVPFPCREYFHSVWKRLGHLMDMTVKETA